MGRTILSESQRLEGYIGDLLAMARLEADDFTLDHTRMDLAAVVEEAGVVWAERGRRAGIDVRLEISEAPLWLDSDPARVRQVLDALADNAVRVCPPGSVVVLAAGGSAETVQLEVRDSGPGLTEDDLAHAFEPGVLHDRYADTRAGGQGLGLALVDRLVRPAGRHDRGVARGGGRGGVRCAAGARRHVRPDHCQGRGLGSSRVREAGRVSFVPLQGLATWVPQHPPRLSEIEFSGPARTIRMPMRGRSRCSPARSGSRTRIPRSACSAGPRCWR